MSAQHLPMLPSADAFGRGCAPQTSVRKSAVRSPRTSSAPGRARFPALRSGTRHASRNQHWLSPRPCFLGPGSGGCHPPSPVPVQRAPRRPVVLPDQRCPGPPGTGVSRPALLYVSVIARNYSEDVCNFFVRNTIGSTTRAARHRRDLPMAVISGRRRIDELRQQLGRRRPASRRLRRTDSQRCKTSRSAGGAADQIRLRRKPQDCKRTLESPSHPACSPSPTRSSNNLALLIFVQMRNAAMSTLCPLSGCEQN